MVKTINGTRLSTLHLILWNKIGVYALTPTKEDATKMEQVLVHQMALIEGLSIKENELMAMSECINHYYPMPERSM